MFSLKFDLLFPSFETAKDAAKKLNALLGSPAVAADPREHQRILDELRRDRETALTRSVAQRNLFL